PIFGVGPGLIAGERSRPERAGEVPSRSRACRLGQRAAGLRWKQVLAMSTSQQSVSRSLDIAEQKLRQGGGQGYAPSRRLVRLNRAPVPTQVAQPKGDYVSGAQATPEHHREQEAITLTHGGSSGTLPLSRA